MKAVLLLTLLVAATSAAPPKDKRFIGAVGDWFHHVGDVLVHTFNDAKNAFNSLTHGLNVNFDVVVDALIPMIDSGMTAAACTSVCVGAAATVLGPAAPLAGTVCGPVCKAALAKLEQAAG